MLRFSPVIPFAQDTRIFITVEGAIPVPKKLLALKTAFNIAALEVLSPTYLPWLKVKGGACPFDLPALIPHKPWPVDPDNPKMIGVLPTAALKCEKCGAEVVVDEAAAAAAVDIPFVVPGFVPAADAVAGRLDPAVFNAPGTLHSESDAARRAAVVEADRAAKVALEVSIDASSRRAADAAAAEAHLAAVAPEAQRTPTAIEAHAASRVSSHPSMAEAVATQGVVEAELTAEAADEAADAADEEAADVASAEAVSRRGHRKR